MVLYNKSFRITGSWWVYKLTDSFQRLNLELPKVTYTALSGISFNRVFVTEISFSLHDTHWLLIGVAGSCLLSALSQ